MKPTILITGGSGFIGSALTEKLINNGFYVHILTTQKVDNMNTHKNIRYFYWQPTQKILDIAALNNVSTIIHLAGASIAGQRWTKNRKETIRNSRIDSLKLIFDQLQNSNHKIEHLICAGAVGWYKTNENNILSETEEADRSSFLGKICAAWEATANDFKKLNIKVSIIRTGMVLGPNDGAWKPIKKTLFFPLIPIFGNGKQHVPWIALIDLVNIYYWIIINKETGIYNAVATEIISNKIMMYKFGKMKFDFVVLIPIPKFILYLIMGAMAKELLLSNMKVSNQKLRAIGFDFQFPNINKQLLQYLNNNS